MGWVRQNLSKFKVVKGIIVVAKGEVTNRLEMAIKGLQDTQQLVKVKEIPITVGNVRDIV
jgi:adenine deaminase